MNDDDRRVVRDAHVAKLERAAVDQQRVVGARSDRSELVHHARRNAGGEVLGLLTGERELDGRELAAAERERDRDLECRARREPGARRDGGREHAVDASSRRDHLSNCVDVPRPVVFDLVE